MRINMVLRALAVLTAVSLTPFVSGAAQGRGPADKCKDKAHPSNRGAVQSAQAPGQAKKVCDEQLPPPPPPPAPPPAPTGIHQIHGVVFDDMNSNGMRDFDESGLEGWSVSISGPINAVAVSDGSGNFRFMLLPNGTYTACQSGQAGYLQTSPASGCYTFTIQGMIETWVSNINFGNLLQ